MASPKARSRLSLDGGLRADCNMRLSSTLPSAPLARGREHLYVLRGDAHALRQALAAELHDGLRRRALLRAPQEEEIAAVFPQLRVLAGDYHVRVAHDAAALGLAEDLRQPHGGHHARAQYVRENIARPHAGQLVGVAHKYQPAVRRQGGQQGLHKRYVNHGALVQHHRPAVQRRVLVVRENDALALGLEARAQQAVDGGRLAARQLAMRLAARPVGAVSSVLMPSASKSASMARTVVVLPVPGPPVRAITRLRAARAMVWRCNGA